MTYHLLFPTLALLLAASTMTSWLLIRNVVQPSYATARAAPQFAPGRGVAGAFGNAAALRNLLYTN